MRAVVVTEAGVHVGDVVQPEPGPGEILVRVSVASLNRKDLLALRRASGKPIGSEWSGVVAGLGSGVQGFKIGDRVMCAGEGGFAEFAVTHAGRAIVVPTQSLTDEQAAVLPMALQTMHDALTRAQLTRGDVVLVHGASSGVGLMGLQIARQLGAGLVIGTSTRDDRSQRLREHGADHVVNSTAPDWSRRILEITSGRGADVIVDMVAGPRFNEVMEAAALRARIVNVGRLGGDSASFDFDLHARKRITYIGVTFRTRTQEEIAELNGKMVSQLGEALAAGKLKLPIDARFSLEQAAEALRHMQDNMHFGKIVLNVTPG